MNSRNDKILKSFYHVLFEHFGPQHWWPGETDFEVIVGAILTQNTNWGNVEKAIANLKKAGCLHPQGLRDVSLPRLAALIRPSGYFRVKARRLKHFIDFLFKEHDGSLGGMRRTPTPRLRQQLLSVNGIGPETADSILLYAFQRPVFVVDAYTRRMMGRHGFSREAQTYEGIQRLFTKHLSPEQVLFNEYHALFVALGKRFCRPRPLCAACPLQLHGFAPVIKRTRRDFVAQGPERALYKE